jgi:hypothetical protein
MTSPLQAVPFFQDLRQRDPSTGLLVLPTSVAVMLRGSATTYAPVFKDFGLSTTLANPLPTGVTPPSDLTGLLGGLDTAGNAGFWIPPGLYDVIINGTIRAPYDMGVSSIDTSAHLEDFDDAHGLQTWASGQFLQASALGDAGGAAQLDENGVMVTGQVLIQVSS